MSRIIVFLISMVMILCGMVTFCGAEELYKYEGEVLAKSDLLGWYNVAMRHVQEKNYAQAIGIFDFILENHPDDPKIHYLRGILYHKLGDIERAKKDYLFLVDNYQADGTIYNNLGAIYASTGDMDEAYKWFTHALREAPGKPEVHDNFAELYREENNYNEAVSEYEKVIAIEDDNTRALFNLGVTYAQMGNFERAQQQWERILKLDPGNKDIQSVIEQAVKYQREVHQREAQKSK